MWNSPAIGTPDPSFSTSSQAPRGLGETVEINAVQDLIRHARMHDLALADEFLTDVLAKLRGWPVEELDRLA